MNDPVVDRSIRIEDKMREEGMALAEATASVDAELELQEALAEAYLTLIGSIRRKRATA